MERKGVTATLILSVPDVPGGPLPAGPAPLGVPTRVPCREGQPDAIVEPAAVSLEFDHVYETHFDFVWRSLRLLGVDEAALDDAAQDTFTVVSRQLPAFEGRSTLRTWLFAILQRVAANYRRRRRRKQTALVQLVDTEGGEPTPLAHAEAAEAARVVERFCAALDPDRRALFVLSVLEELPAAEVSAALGLPVAKVYSRVHALREGVKRALAARGSDDGGA